MATGETGIQTIVLHELTSWVVWKQLKNNIYTGDFPLSAGTGCQKLALTIGSAVNDNHILDFLTDACQK